MSPSKFRATSTHIYSWTPDDEVRKLTAEPQPPISDTNQPENGLKFKNLSKWITQRTETGSLKPVAELSNQQVFLIYLQLCHSNIPGPFF